MSNNWQTVSLGDVLEPVERSEEVKTLSSVRYAGVRWHAEGVYARATVKSDSVRAKTLSRLKLGDITYNRMWATKGAFGVVWEDAAECLVTNDFPIFRAREELLPRYIELWFEHPAFQEAASVMSTGSTERRRLKEKDFLAMCMILPPLPHQHAVIDLMDYADNLIAGLNQCGVRSRNAIDQIRRDYLRRISKAKASRPLGELLTRMRRPIAVSAGDRYRQIGLRSHGKGVFHKPAVCGAELGSKKVFAIESGDLIFNIVFAWEGAVGVAGDNESGMCASHRFPTYRPSTGIPVEFFRHLFSAPEGIELLKLSSPGSAGRNKTLDQEMLMRFNVPAPDPEFAREMASVLAAAEEMSARYEESRVAAESARAAILNDLLTGRRTLPDSYFCALEKLGS